MTIPRLELLAVLIGCRLLKFVSDELQIPLEMSHLWTDSACVLDWIKSTKTLPIFVQNRIKEIRTHSNINFCFIPGDQNPADLATRRCSWDEFFQCQVWWNAPPWTSCAMDQWPKFQKPIITPDMLLKLGERNTQNAPIYSAPVLVEHTDDLSIFDILTYSSLHRLLRVTVFVFRFLKLLLPQPKNQFIVNLFRPFNNYGSLTAIEIKFATNYWIFVTQHRYFDDVFTCFSSSKPLPLIQQLGLFIDPDGILRCRG